MSNFAVYVIIEHWQMFKTHALAHSDFGWPLVEIFCQFISNLHVVVLYKKVQNTVTLYCTVHLTILYKHLIVFSSHFLLFFKDI